MRVSGDYTWPDGSTASFEINDGIDGFDPIRLRDLRREIVGIIAEVRGEPALTEPAPEVE